MAAWPSWVSDMAGICWTAWRPTVCAVIGWKGALRIVSAKWPTS